MAPNDFCEDLRFCSDCDEYVPFLQGPERGYCGHCGGLVRLFSREDTAAFWQGILRESSNPGHGAFTVLTPKGGESEVGNEIGAKEVP